MKKDCTKYEFCAVEQRVGGIYNVHGCPLKMGLGLNWVKVGPCEC